MRTEDGGGQIRLVQQNSACATTNAVDQILAALFWPAIWSSFAAALGHFFLFLFSPLPVSKRARGH